MIDHVITILNTMATTEVQEVKMRAFLLLVFIAASSADPSFNIDYEKDTFRMNGQIFRYISGSIHYQRVPYQYWDDRLRKMAAAGLNAIQTYVGWNGHEKMPGVYDFTGQQDIENFLQIAQSHNLSVVLRPGPYICAEWEFGGFPAWLLNNPGIKLRTMDKNYIKAVDSWLTKLYTVIQPHLFINGGPIITVQIENEYGSYYACDKNYLTFLVNKAKTILGNDVVLFTTDGDGDDYLKCGTISGAYSTVDFGITSDPAKNFAIQRHKEPHGPLVNSEFYTGWLDHWGERHSTTDKQQVTDTLDKMLALGANVNMYMFEGGTNFEFWNGANYPYGSVPTSYDYDAPLTEAGDITDKYMMIKDVIGKYRPLPELPIPPNTPKKAYGKIMLSFVETVYTYVQSFPSVSSTYPVNMEKLNHFYGFLLYQHVLKQDIVNGKLDLSGVRDRGYVSVGPKLSPNPIGVVERETKNTTLQLSGKKGDYLFILVENQGRINYGSQINNNTKGLVSNITVSGSILTDWIHFPVQLEELSTHLNQRNYFSPSPRLSDNGLTLPALYKGQLTIEGKPQDTYIDMSEWRKGQVFINGHNMGRYWPHMGPQVRLYIPKFFLREGNNEVVLMELESSPCEESAACRVDFEDTPLINGTVPSNTAADGKSDGFFEMLIKLVVQFWQTFLLLF